MVPLAVGSTRTVSVKVAVAPGGRSPKLHDRLPAAPTSGRVQVAPGASRATKVVPAGRVSVTTAPAAVAGPWLATAKVYVAVAPGFAWEGPVAVTATPGAKVATRAWAACAFARTYSPFTTWSWTVEPLSSSSTSW